VFLSLPAWFLHDLASEIESTFVNKWVVCMCLSGLVPIQVQFGMQQCFFREHVLGLTLSFNRNASTSNFGISGWTCAKCLLKLMVLPEQPITGHCFCGRLCTCDNLFLVLCERFGTAVLKHTQKTVQVMWLNITFDATVASPRDTRHKNMHSFVFTPSCIVDS